MRDLIYTSLFWDNLEIISPATHDSSSAQTFSFFKKINRWPLWLRLFFLRVVWVENHPISKVKANAILCLNKYRLSNLDILYVQCEKQGREKRFVAYKWEEYRQQICCICNNKNKYKQSPLVSGASEGSPAAGWKVAAHTQSPKQRFGTV